MKKQEEGLAVARYHMSAIPVLSQISNSIFDKPPIDLLGQKHPFRLWLEAVNEKLKKLFHTTVDEVLQNNILKKDKGEFHYLWKVYQLRSDPPMSPENAAKHIAKKIGLLKTEDTDAQSNEIFLAEVFSKHKGVMSKAGNLDGVDMELAKVLVLSGFKDGNKDDDKISVTPATWKATDLKPSQSTMILKTAIDLAFFMIDKNETNGELGAIISKDGYIMDGHHRWASTILIKGKNGIVSGYKADMDAKKLIPVLNVITKGMFGVAAGKKGTGSFAEFTDKNVRSVLTGYLKDGITGKRSQTPEDVKRLLEKEFGDAETGIDSMAKNVELMIRKIPAWSPKREQMPVISAGQVKDAAEKMKAGEVDHAAPYAESLDQLPALADTFKPVVDIKSVDKLREKMSEFVSKGRRC